jgi:pyruvate/2-oxoglutarate dehydrogenase complex dihydrolipoamide acyltransferase (E2) component
VSFKVQGRIVDLPVEEGQQVEQGALLARLEDADSSRRSASTRPPCRCANPILRLRWLERASRR